MLIESSVDIGNMIIDAFILRDPGNYKDVIDILELEGVISKDTQNHINDTVEIRKQFAHHYTELEVETLVPLFDTSIPYYRQFERSYSISKKKMCQLPLWKRRLFIMKNYKGYLIDLDGTMYMGTAEIDGAAQFIDYLNKTIFLIYMLLITLLRRLKK